MFPALNRLFFPDLNGLWLGETKSNWPVIAAIRDAASGTGQSDLEAIGNTPLQAGEIAMQIAASLFAVSIRSSLSSTKGESRSLFAAVRQDQEFRDFQFIYLYRQTTPEPERSDEESHVGAGELYIRSNFEMDGAYWTRRRWREGMNTAGRIQLKRLSARHIPATADLLLAAREYKKSSKAALLRT